jgi:uncharacterized repeat protein (TIGR01451 family)
MKNDPRSTQLEGRPPGRDSMIRLRPAPPAAWRRVALAFALAACLPVPVIADYVGSLVNRIFLDPASIPQVVDGYDNGDVVSFILETTPADTGSDNGHAAWMSVYVPPGAEVLGAEFVLPASNGGYDVIPAEDTDDTYDGWGSRGARGYSPTTGATQLAPGYVNEVQQDTGIFYSTDIRTQLVVDGVDDDCDGTPDLLDPTGGPPAQIIYNRFDWDHTLGFGVGGATSGNGGQGNTPVRGTGCTGDDGVGCTWTGVGSIVSGSDTYYVNDYNPGFDDCSDGPGGAFVSGCDGDGIADDFLAETACVGPFQRIAYPNSKLGGSNSPEKCRPGNTCPPDFFEADPTVVWPAYETGEIRYSMLPTSAGWDFGVDGALPSGNLALSSNPSPETTYMVRFVHGKRRLGEFENARITLRIIDSALFNASVFIDDGAAEPTDDETFCLDSTGGDTSDTAAKDNPFRYYEPQHECSFLAGKGNLLKQIKFVNNVASSGASLSVGDILSFQISFTNTSGTDLTDVDLYDRAEDLLGSPVGDLDLLEPGDPLCAWPSYDGDLPGMTPAYQAGSAAAGTATWDRIATLGAGTQVNVFLCAEVTGGGVNDRIDNSALIDYNFSPLPADRVIGLRSTAGGTISTSISGTVYSDTDGSGDLTVGDAPLVGVTVSLYDDLDGDGFLDPGEPLIDTRITLSDGSYVFAGIPGGDYIVVQSDAPGWTSTGDKDNLGGPCGVGNGCNAIGTTVSGGGASTLNDFFDQPPAGGTNIISGATFVDRDQDGAFELGDGEVGQGGILVRLYRDNNGDGMVDAGDTELQTQLTDALGQYQFSLTEDPQVQCGVGGCDYVIEIDETTLPPGASLTTDSVETAHFDTLGDPPDTGNDFGFFGGAGTTGGVCFAVADSVDELVAYEPATMVFTDIGPTGTSNIEAIAFDPGTATLCAANADRMGTLDLGTGLFTPLPSSFGSCTLPGGSSVGVDDVDGLTFDPFTRLLWGSVRRGGAAVNDVLVVVDPVTGLVAPDEVDPFGPGVTCVEIDTFGPLGLTDIDDLAVDPTGRGPGPDLLLGTPDDTGPLLYAVANQDPGGGGSSDRLIVIRASDGAVIDRSRIMLGASGLNDIEGLGFDNAAVLYATTGNQIAGTNDKLYTLDKATANAVQIADLFRAGPPSLEDYESVDCLTAGANVVSGTVFADGNGSGLLDPGEVGQAGVTVSLYLDVNGDNEVDAGDELLQTVSTDASGEYSFFLGVEGEFVLETGFPAGYPAGAVLITDSFEEADFIGFNQTESGNDFGFALPNVPEITKTSSAAGGVVAQGDTITYTLIPRIAGPQLLTNIEVEDFIPAGTSFVGGSATPTQTEGPDPLEWEFGDHAPGAPGTVESALCPAAYSQTPLADTFIDQDKANDNLGGTDPLKTRPEAAKQKHALLRWDLSSIPAGAVIDEARLTLTSGNARNNHVVEIREVLTNWVEAGGNGATWNDAAGTVNDWATVDVTTENPLETDGFVFGFDDYDTTVVTPPTLVPIGGNTPLTAVVTDIVTSWLAGPNYGLVLLATGTDNGDANWDSKEDGTPAKRPLLEIFYRVSTGTGCSAVDTLTPSADTFVQEDTATTNRGGDADLKTRPEATKQKQVLIDFDVVGIPPGATINSATFTIEVTGARGSDHTVTLHRMLTAWTESGATWNDAIPGTSDWLSPVLAGNPENPDETDGFVFGDSDYAEDYGTIDVTSNGSRSLDVTALVNAWVNGGAAQNGIVLLATGADNGDAKYNSRDKSPPPTLVVDWTLDPDQTTNAITALGTLVSHGDTVTVTMNLTSAKADTGVTPSALTVNGVNGASAVCGPPSPGSQSIPAGTPITFDWTCTASATAGQLLGQLTFEASAVGDNVAFANAVSHSVMVTRPLQFQVLVDDPLDANQTTIVNTGIADSDQTFPDATDTTVDAVVKGVIGDRVWLDTDGDGVEDIGEEGIANVEVSLRVDDDGTPGPSAGDSVYDTRITGADGGYLFTRLPPGSYWVDVSDATLPVGLVQSPGNIDPPTDPIASAPTYLVATDEVFLTADFGYTSPSDKGVIGDHVWNDIDRDGVQDPSEVGIGDVTLELRSAGPDGVFGTGDDVVEDTATTAADGSYLFTAVTPGEYIVVVTDTGGELAGFAPTVGPQSEGSGVSAPVTVAADDVVDDLDFGYAPAACLPRIDFETDALGNPLVAGQVIDDEFSAWGLTISVVADPPGDPFDQMMIFDSVNPTGGDVDLGSPNETCTPPGPGVGIDGEVGQPGENCSVLGNLLIISEDGDSSDPDDNGGGGVVTFSFSEEVEIEQVSFLDAENADRVQLFDSGMTEIFNQISSAPGDNAFELLLVDTAGARTMDITFQASGALEAIDFCLGSIRNKVWLDADGDGFFDAGEEGIGGVTVTLLSDPDGIPDNGDEVVVATTITDANGDFGFDGLEDGDYLIQISDTAAELSDLSGTTAPGIAGELAVSVVDGVDVVGIDFGYNAPGTLGDRVWSDVDGDGVQDAGEPGIGGVLLNLLDGLGNPVLDAGSNPITATTAADGSYLFSGLEPGDYLVEVDATNFDVGQPLDGYTQIGDPDEAGICVTCDDQGSSTLGLGDSDLSLDFGYQATTAAVYPISGTVFEDVDEDGFDDGPPAENGFAGVTVELRDATGNVIGTTTTDALGFYQFDDQPNGSYTVAVTDAAGILDGYRLTSGLDAIDVTVDGAAVTDIDFGYVRDPGTASIGDTVWLDADGDALPGPTEPGIPNVAVDLYQDDGDGVLEPTVEVLDGRIDLDGDGDVDGFDDGELAGIQIIDGRLDLDGDGSITAADGGTFNGATVIAGEIDLNASGGVDGTDDGTLSGDDGLPVATTLTDGNGGYIFPGLDAGAYFVDVRESTVPDSTADGTHDLVETGYPGIDPSDAITVSDGERYEDADFGYVPRPGTAAIGDRVWHDTDGDGAQDDGELGIAGVDIIISGPGGDTTITTGADGFWMATGLSPAASTLYSVNYDAGTVPAGLTQTFPGDVSYQATVNDGDLFTHLDYGFTGGSYGSIGSLVWLDLNGDGDVDSGEPPIEGVTVSLIADTNGDGVWDPDGADGIFGTADDEPTLETATTDPAGNYLFTGVPLSADYLVDVSDIGGVLVGLQKTSGTADADNNSQDDPYDVAMPGVPTAILTGDFGYTPAGGFGSIGNKVWHDLDGDGLRDAGEPGIEGVTIELWLDVDGDKVLTPGVDNLVRNATTDLSGEYEFNSLPLGDYLVKVTDVSGALDDFVKTTGTPTVDDNSQANPYPVTLAAGNSDNVTADFGYQADPINSVLTIAGTVFEDVDNDAVFDDGSEPEIENATVSLYRDLDGNGVLDPTDSFFGSVQTDANGDYLFTNLPPGEYLLAVDVDGTDVDDFLQTTQSGTGGVQPVSLPTTFPPDPGAPNSTGNNFGFWNGGVVTNPITLAWFKAEERGGGVHFEWMTATETANVGFHLYAVGAEGLGRLNEEIIPSQVIDSLEPQRYAFEAWGVEAEEFLLEDVDLLGVRRYHGPFRRGEARGAEPKPERVAWGEIRAERSARRAARGAVRSDVLRSGDEAGSGGWNSGRIGPPWRGWGGARLEVSEDGIYRVSYEQLLAAGVNLRGAPIAALALTVGGEPVALRVEGQVGAPRYGRGRFGPGSYIEFVGEALDTLYTRTNVYTLGVDWRQALRVERDRRPAAPWASVPAAYEERLAVDRDQKYILTAPSEDPWYEAHLLAYGGSASREFAVEVDGYAGGPAGLEVELWGLSEFPRDPDHHVELEWNGSRIGEEWFDGRRVHRVSSELWSGAVVEGENRLQVTLPGDTGTTWDMVAFDRLWLRYARRFEPREGRLRFEAVGEAFEIQGVSGEAVAYRMGGEVPVLLEGLRWDGSGRARIPGQVDPAVYEFAETAALRVPGIAPSTEPAELSGETRLLVISHEEFLEGIAPLVNARRAEGWTVAVLDVAEVYARWSHGVADPQAIRDAIRYAAAEHATEALLLVGGDTYDYHDNLGVGSISFIPSLYTATDEIVRFAPVDPLYGDVDGDGVPDVAVGRLPVRTPEELDSVVARTLEYAEIGFAGTALLAADGYDAPAGYSFTAASDDLAAGLGGWALERAYIDELGKVDARERLIDGINGGVALTSYFGHSGPTAWSFDNLFNAADAAALENTGRPTVVTQWGCWNTYHVTPSYNTLGHKLLLSGGRGAAAVLGAATLTQAPAERKLGKLLFARLGQPGVTLGQALVDAKQELARSEPDLIDVILGWTLLGDPTLRMDH